MNPILELRQFLQPAHDGDGRRRARLQPAGHQARRAGPATRPSRCRASSDRSTFEHVTFGYNPERPVLHDVSFDAKPGQMFALVGATGSGKSSIISLIARFYQPQQGRVLVDGHDIRLVTGESPAQADGPGACR